MGGRDWRLGGGQVHAGPGTHISREEVGWSTVGCSRDKGPGARDFGIWRSQWTLRSTEKMGRGTDR